MRRVVCLCLGCLWPGPGLPGGLIAEEAAGGAAGGRRLPEAAVGARWGLAGWAGRCGPLAESRRGRVWRRAGLEAEPPYPSPSGPLARFGSPGLLGASRSLSSPFCRQLPSWLWDDPRCEPVGTLSCQMPVERCPQWEETGCVRMMGWLFT